MFSSPRGVGRCQQKWVYKPKWYTSGPVHSLSQPSPSAWRTEINLLCLSWPQISFPPIELGLEWLEDIGRWKPRAARLRVVLTSAHWCFAYTVLVLAGLAVSGEETCYLDRKRVDRNPCRFIRASHLVYLPYSPPSCLLPAHCCL